MSSSKKIDSVSWKKLLSHRSLGFKEQVEWMGPVGSSGNRDANVRYRMEGEDIFFPLLDEKDLALRWPIRGRKMR